MRARMTARLAWKIVDCTGGGILWSRLSLSTQPGAMTSPVDPLAVGQKMVAVLDDGRRTGTYKLAVAVALLDLCCGTCTG